MNGHQGTTGTGSRGRPARAFSTPPASCSCRGLSRTSRSARSPSGSSTARPPSTATSPVKDDIFFALAEEGFRLLGDPGTAREAPLRRSSRSSASARSSGASTSSAASSRRYFALMFVDRSVPSHQPRVRAVRVRAREPSSDLDRPISQRCIDAKVFSAHRRARRRDAPADDRRLLGVAVLRLVRPARPGRKRRSSSRATCSTSRSPACDRAWRCNRQRIDSRFRRCDEPVADRASFITRGVVDESPRCASFRLRSAPRSPLLTRACSTGDAKTNGSRRRTPHRVAGVGGRGRRRRAADRPVHPRDGHA